MSKSLGDWFLYNRKLAQFVVRCVVLAATGGTLVGYSAYVMLPAGQAASSDDNFILPQVSTSAAKTNRLPSRVQAPETPEAAYSVASLPQIADRVHDTAAMPAISQTEPQHTAALAPPQPPRRPTRLPPPPSTTSGLLDDAQIAGLKDRLRLTPDQTEYWPAVETALRGFAKLQQQNSRLKHASGGKVDIDVNSPEVQRLIWAARPLIMMLREDQKREVRKLARVIGLESVASKI